MKTLKLVKPNLELHENLAIIGSSGRLKNASHGMEIDTFDEVVRFNRAITEGHEGDVGVKETLRVVNLHSLQCKPFWRGGRLQPHQNLIKTLRDTRLLAFCEPKIYLECASHIHKSVAYHQLFRWSTQHLLTYKIPTHLSVGVFFVSLCVESSLVPHLYGFDYNNEPRTHYFWERTPETPCHDTPSEMKLLIQMDKDKKIVLH